MGADVALAADSAVVGGSVHVGFAISRHKRAGRIKEREGKRISRRSGRSVRATKPG
jgi:hypothetical protein